MSDETLHIENQDNNNDKTECRFCRSKLLHHEATVCKECGRHQHTWRNIANNVGIVLGLVATLFGVVATISQLNSAKEERITAEEALRHATNAVAQASASLDLARDAQEKATNSIARAEEAGDLAIVANEGATNSILQSNQALNKAQATLNVVDTVKKSFIQLEKETYEQIAKNVDMIKESESMLGDAITKAREELNDVLKIAGETQPYAEFFNGDFRIQWGTYTNKTKEWTEVSFDPVLEGYTDIAVSPTIIGDVMDVNAGRPIILKDIDKHGFKSVIKGRGLFKTYYATEEIPCSYIVVARKESSESQ